MKRLFNALPFTILLSINVDVSAQPGVHCGTERWKVKTLTDSTIGNIDPTEVQKTINWFRTRATFLQQMMEASGNLLSIRWASLQSRPRHQIERTIIVVVGMGFFVGCTDKGAWLPAA